MKQHSIVVSGRYSALSRLNNLLSGSEYRDCKLFIILDEHTYTYCLPMVVSRVEALQGAEFMEVPLGEEAKDIAIAQQLWLSLMESGADRHSVILNLGGGCVSDLGGFVASTYQRGIRYINIPTTLIGMIDAAIGGKTALNLANYKNQVGTFYSPIATYIEPMLLSSLPQQELLSGIGEMLKTFCIADEDLYRTVCKRINDGNILPDNTLIKACVDFKQSVVKADPLEHNIRKILNFGHTIGHGIEAYSHQSTQPLCHGIAVALGMWCALYLSVKKLGLAPSVLDDFTVVLHRLTTIPNYNLRDTEAILQFILRDKKNDHGQILAVLLQTVGTPVIDVALDTNEIRDALLALGHAA